MKIVIFDLDDTLYNEIDFLYSAYSEIASSLEKREKISCVFETMIEFYRIKANVFCAINELYGLSYPINLYLDMYRKHFPDIKLSVDNHSVLFELKRNGVFLGLITDGRSITQRNKIKALGLDSFISDDCIIISEEFGTEKPNLKNYTYFSDKFGDADFFYVGDNPSKDFVSPNKLGWMTICLLDSGRNIHNQNFGINVEYIPKLKIRNLKELVYLI